jgi:hypothetical protein
MLDVEAKTDARSSGNAPGRTWCVWWARVPPKRKERH